MNLCWHGGPGRPVMNAFQPLNCLQTAFRRSCENMAGPLTKRARARWDDQRAEKAIRGACPSVAQRTAEHRQRSESQVDGTPDRALPPPPSPPPPPSSRRCFLISWMTGQFVPSAVSPNRKLLKEGTWPVTQHAAGHSRVRRRRSFYFFPFYSAVYFVPAEC